MTILPIHHDEWILGYLGRLANVNNATYHNELIRLICQQRSETRTLPVEDESYLHLLADKINMSVGRLVFDHTLFKLSKIFEVDRSSQEGDDRPFAPKQLGFVTSSYRTDAWFCPECVEEDRKRRYFAHWRRSHQIPGAWECHVHRAPLLRTSYSGMLNFTPCVCSEFKSFSAVDLSKLKGATWISDTVDILRRMLAGEQTIHAADAIDILTDVCGIATTKNRVSSILSVATDIAENAPADWLSNFLSNAGASASECLEVLRPLFLKGPKHCVRLQASTVALLFARYLSRDRAAAMLFDSSSI